MHILPDGTFGFYMQYIQGNNINQAVRFPKCLDELVDQDNEVRIIDLFVETIKSEDFRFAG